MYSDPFYGSVFLWVCICRNCCSVLFQSAEAGAGGAFWWREEGWVVREGEGWVMQVTEALLRRIGFEEHRWAELRFRVGICHVFSYLRRIKVLI